MGTAKSSTDVYSAIADPTRRALLLRLAKGERNVNELLEAFSISQPSVSRHLKILRDVGLVRSNKRGRLRVYKLDPVKLREVYDWVTHFEHFWDKKLDALGEYLSKQDKAKTK
ncbi:metalloregulator ArsR/SmtB family transcription factor [soil metagenome]